VEPDVAGFAYDDFKRAADLIKVGEASMRNALPQVRKWLETPAEQADATCPETERPAMPRTAPMPAD
jgi:hypothetical protein